MGISTTIAGLKLAPQGKGGKGKKSINTPIKIIGTPDYLVGNILLQNTTDSKLTLKSMPLEAAELQDVAHQPLSEIRIASRLYPGQQDNVHIEFPVAANTPPGLYEAKFHVGDQTQAAQIQVNPLVEITLTPDEMTLYTEGKNQFEIEFEVTNEGNVPLNMGDRVSVALQTETGLAIQVQKALLDICEDTDSEPGLDIDDEEDDSDSILDDLDNLDSDKYSSLVNKLLCALSQQQAGELTMSLDNSLLDPGETLTFKSTIILPDDLPLNHHYFAEVEILSETLQVDIYTYGA